MTTSPRGARLQIQSPFRPDDFPDGRLARRARVTMRALAAGALHGRRETPALRRGAQRFYANDRIDSARLLRRSARVVDASLRGLDVLLSCEDTMYVRGDAPDAGPLSHGADRGYVVHLSFGVRPGTGRPCAWLGAAVWSRLGDVHDQDHKTRPPAERESAKWAALRRQVRARLRAAGVRARVVSVTDREGDAWASLRAAVDAGDEVVTRATQDRRLADGGRLRARVRRARVAGHRTLTLHTKAADGRTGTRRVRVAVRWARVTLAPPGRDPFWRADAPLTVVAVCVREVRAPRRGRRFESWLLTTCPVADDADALTVVAWYGDRWGVEVGNDVVKNALEVEVAVRADISQFERALALAGPTAAQFAAWWAAARVPDAPAADHLTAAERADLAQAARYHGVAVPTRAWTMADVVALLGRIGGGDVRPTRPVGWRVALRGWQRVEEFRRIAAFVRRPRTPRAPARARRARAPDDDPPQK